MQRRTTELRHHKASNIDLLSGDEAAQILLSGQVSAVQAVASASNLIAEAASLLAQRVRAGGNIVYCAAGSSGLMALADGLELPGTFGIPHSKIKILFAGGDACLKELRGGPEDDEQLAAQDIGAANLSPNDAIIVLSASGSTPYAVRALELARERGSATIALANNAETPLLQNADVAIFLPTPPEVIAGSTRMGAGSAQKVALNIISTLMAMELGHVHDGHMVNVVADNEKLRQRAQGIVMAISGSSVDVANEALDQSNGAVKLAVLLASGVADTAAANKLLESNGQKIRPSLLELEQSYGSQ